MPMFSGSGKWSGAKAGSGRETLDLYSPKITKQVEKEEATRTSINWHAGSTTRSSEVDLERKSSDSIKTSPIPKKENATEEVIENDSDYSQNDILIEVPVKNDEIAKVRSFCFKSGKVWLETPPPQFVFNPENIFLRVEGREICVQEKYLKRHSQHFCRVLEDISNDPNSEYLCTENDDFADSDSPLALISYDTMTPLIAYISGDLNDLGITEENVEKFQRAARFLCIQIVETQCKKYVQKGLNSDNCIQRFLLADSFLGWTDTSNLIQLFIEINFEDIVSNNDHAFFTSMNHSQMKRILSSSRLHVNIEDTVLYAAITWIKKDLSGRLCWLSTLIEEVQWPCISGPTILEKLLEDDLVANDPECVRLVQQGLDYFSMDEEDQVALWTKEPHPSRWPHVIAVLSYAEKIVEFYDFQTTAWGVLTEKPDWVFGAEMVTVRGNLYTIGGVSSRQVDHYNVEKDDWTSGEWPSLKKPRLAHGVAVALSPNGGIIYVAGGSPQVGGPGHRDIEYIEPYIPAECECTLCGPYDHLKWEVDKNLMADGRTFTAMIVVDDNVIMVGGDLDPNLTYSTVEVFNRKTGSWTKTTSTKYKRDSCRLVQLDGYIYAVGGYDNTSNKHLTSCERFSLKTRKWEDIPKMKLARRSPGVITYRGQIYAVGGMGTKKDLTGMEKYNNVTNKWEVVPGHMKNLSGWLSAVILPKPVRMMRHQKSCEDKKVL